jgi:adenosine deaminase/aminodeoxyfutalosine deaminase
MGRLLESPGWLRALPKAELHLHLEGTVLPETLVELDQRRTEPRLTLEEARSLYRYSDFTGFLMAFKAVTERLRTPEDYELITYRMLERLARQGVVHAEVYVAVGVIYYWKRIAFEPIFEAMERARVRAEQKLGITLFWIFDAVRHFGAEQAARVFDKAAELKADFPSVVGIGIGGDERQTGPEPFEELYRKARAAGLRLTAHAGESVGPEGIWGALNIGAERIGHCLSAYLDSELMEVLAERQIPIEACISSNLRTGCCRSLAEHPVRRYFDAGLMVTLNSDDPALFESDLDAEYRLASAEFGFTDEHLRELATNSIEASFLPPERKAGLLRQIDSME